ncbi:MAG: RnfABCDGE type electron transport complex subunit D [Tissierellia bacterium]|nr:RnfABCDGE type electron transport complex subunit D [Tissierellia bacterium]
MDNTENKINEVVLDDLLVVSSSPHIRSNETVSRIMLDVIIALVPTSIAAIYFFGLKALVLILSSVIAAVVAEALIQKAFKKEVTINDLSAVVTGLLLALNVPVSLPVWKLVVGSFFAIIVVKQFFGGLGSNFMNPALAARAVLMASFAKDMGKFTEPLTDMISMVTPLSGGPMPTYQQMLIGNMPGCIGEVSKIALLIGAAYLVFRKVISLRIPLIYIGTTFICVLGLGSGLEGSLQHILTGGLILGAFYMATDYASSPVNKKGQVVFAIGCGILTALIRIFGGYPEGVSFAIIIMNIFVPLIEKFTAPKTFGTGGAK